MGLCKNIDYTKTKATQTATCNKPTTIMCYNPSKFDSIPLNSYGEIDVSTHICTCSGDDLYPLLSFRIHKLRTGKCYGAEICAILLLLRCSFFWNRFSAKLKFSDFGAKTVDYSPRFHFWESEKSIEESMPF